MAVVSVHLIPLMAAHAPIVQVLVDGNCFISLIFIAFLSQVSFLRQFPFFKNGAHCAAYDETIDTASLCSLL